MCTSSNSNKLRKLVSDGWLHGVRKQAHSSLLTEIAALSDRLEQVGFPLSDERLWEVLAERYGAQPAPEVCPYLVLLCCVLNLSLYRPGPPDVLHDLDPVWLGAEGGRSIIVSAANAVIPALRKSALPVHLFDLLITTNRALKNQGLDGTDAATLRRIMALCPLTEAVSEDIYTSAETSNYPTHHTR